MAFIRWGCNFDGPWPNTDLLRSRPGIWIIWQRIADQWTVLEVREASNVREAVASKVSPVNVGIQEQDTSIHYSAFYTPHLCETARRELWARIARLACPIAQTS